MPRLAVYSATKHAVKGLTEALSVEWGRHGVRVADVLPGLIETAILTTTPDHSAGGGTMPMDAIRARGPKTGMFRLMPASSVAEAAWRAYPNRRGCIGMYRPAFGGSIGSRASARNSSAAESARQCLD
jgi:NAD(P)-dependent dehydrogenase (short-subunit alcohol dehydrogenase family)